jgi:NADH-quinone oxidoreductase subunit N
VIPAQVAPLDTPDVEWFDVTPMLIVAGGALVLLVVGALAARRPFSGAYAWYTALVGALGVASSFVLWDDVHDDGSRSALSGALGIDGFSVFFMLLISITVILGALLLDGYLRREGIDGPEMYVLMMLSGVGGMVMAASNDLIVLFLGLETLSIALYVMAAMHLRRPESQEAGIKYFVLGGFSSAFFLYGIALVYGATGSTRLVEISQYLADNVLADDGVLLAGLALLLVGFGFKIAAVPFHTWTPDVYQGSPTPVAGFMASAAKGPASPACCACST